MTATRLRGSAKLTRLDRTDVPQLESARLRLRPWRTTDVGAYEAIMMHPDVLPKVGSGMRFKVKRTMASALARVSHVESRRAIDRFRRHWERCGYGEWAVEEKATGELIGKIGLVYHPDWRASDAKVEVGWMLAPSVWGRGFATEGARVALAHAFGELMLPRVISIARTDNDRSIRVMERLGLRAQGHARWRGSRMVWYAIDRVAWLEAEAAKAVGAAR